MLLSGSEISIVYGVEPHARSDGYALIRALSRLLAATGVQLVSMRPGVASRWERRGTD